MDEFVRYALDRIFFFFLGMSLNILIVVTALNADISFLEKEAFLALCFFILVYFGFSFHFRETVGRFLFF